MRYLLTISCQQKKVQIYQKDLQEVLRWIPLEGILHSSYETTGSYGQLHYHAIVDYSGLWKAYTQYGDGVHCNSFRVQWSKVRNLRGAIRYVYKDTHNNKILQDQIIRENWYKYNLYMFEPSSGATPLYRGTHVLGA